MNQDFPNLAVALALLSTAVAIALIAVVARRNRAHEVAVDRSQLDTMQKNWRGPSELVTKPTPRDVRYTGKAYALFGIIGASIGVGVVALGLLYPGIRRDTEHAALLEREGVAAMGTIVDRSVHRGKSDRYHVTYTYMVNGHEYRANAEVRFRAYQAMTAGTSAPIHYAPSQPEVSRADDAISDPPWLRYLVVLPAFFLLFIPAMVMNHKKLLSLGTPTGAIVSRVSSTKGGMAIRYQFLDATGTTVTGQDTVPSRVAPRAGETVPVVYDPDHPRRNKLYPLSLVRVDE